MCGITGKIYFDSEKYVVKEELEKMTNSIIHRGPDDVGYYIDGNVGLGFRRLSILDLKSGHQPMSDNSEVYWIIFNGEVFNFKDLRNDLKKKGYHFKTNTDTEVLVNLYAEYKEKCVDFLRGMFSFVIWDKRNKELFGARDRFGVKPFYYYIDNEKFVWGSEIKSIFAASDISKEISLPALDYYFAYGHSQMEESIFKQTKKLLPGHYFVLKPDSIDKLQIKQYWKVFYNPDYSKSESYWKENLYNVLNESIKMRMISDVPLGVFLSGGIDSSIVVSLMAQNSTDRIKTFSVGFQEANYSELKYARKIAEYYNTDHHELIVEPDSIELLPKLVHAFDEPFADSSAIPTYYISKFARGLVTVALSGDGGDELFAGYSSYPKMLKLNSIFYNRTLFNRIFSSVNKVLPDYFYGKGLTYYLSKNRGNIGAYFCLWKDYEREKIFNPHINEQLEKNYSEKVKIDLLGSMNGDFISKMQRLDIQTYLVDDILTKVDITSMMNSLEIRVPLLDHKFAELSFTIPWELKLKGNDKKHILKETFKNFLPTEILAHKKQGFAIPLNVWFKEDLKSYAFDNLLNSPYLKNYLNLDYIAKGLINHQKGIRDYSSKIWSLLVLNEWLTQHK